jgi:SAM-dependent methyltransferase
MNDSTKNFYERNAQSYFSATYDLNLQPLWEKLTRNLRKGNLILDLGCGSGRDLRYFFFQGYKVIGLDYSCSLLELAKDYSKQPLVCADFTAVPFKNNTFDAVWALGSLLHVSPNLMPSALLEIRRILKSGAIFFTAMKKGCGEDIDSSGRYFVYYLQDEWQGILKSHGFEILDIEEDIVIRRTLSGEKKEVVWIMAVTTLAESYVQLDCEFSTSN